jgi:ABC-type glycerol-3-phosphate transport system substrate-binding protein
MMSMSRTALFMMALMLVAATAATAATALAAPKAKLPRPDQAVAEAIYSSSDALRRAKVRSLRVVYKAEAPFRVPSFRR